MADTDQKKKPAKPRPKARDLNETIRYTMWSVFASVEPLDADRAKLIDEVSALVDEWAEQDVVVRGWYDVAGLRPDAEVMLWLHAPTSDLLQRAYHSLRRSVFGAHFDPVWSVMGLHRPAEFNKSHIPAFLAEREAQDYLCVYPFVRSYEWYLLPEAERRELLVEHGMLGRQFEQVRANTVAAFALGDYEWILAFESPELHAIVDLMRELRATGARRHVREETPFYTGRRREFAALAEDLP